MMHAKEDEMGITHRVTPVMELLREATVDPQQGIATLTSMDLVDTTLEQIQGIRI